LSEERKGSWRAGKGERMAGNGESEGSKMKGDVVVVSCALLQSKGRVDEGERKQALE
jgi:hypothetical protein